MNRNRFGLCGVAALLICTALSCPPAAAQWDVPTSGGKFQNEPGFYNKNLITIPVRSAGHDTFSRMVMDWPSRVTFDTSQPEDGLVVIAFKRRALADMTGVRTAPETNFGNVDVISALDKALKIAVSIPPGAKYKVYTLGYKVILDVDDVPGQKRGAFKIVKAKPEAVAPPAGAATALQPVAEAQSSVTATPAPPVQTAGPLAVDWTETRNFPAAVFTRYGQVYFVTDNPEGKFPPRITDKDGKALAVTELPTEGGKVYRLTLPSGHDPQPDISATSERLGWSFTINPDTPPSPRPAVIRLVRNEQAQQSVQIALPGTGKMVRFTDPDSGESYAALPAPNASASVQSPLATPDFETVPTVAGFVVRPLNDRLQIQASPQAVQLSLPGGMRYGDRLIVAAPQQPPAPAAAQNTDTATPTVTNQKRLLFFSRWMAGLPDNYTESRQVLEHRLNKAADTDKAAALLDLAKFELAHGYGPEALGYLELAFEAAPALARSSEFRALRAVGYTMMGDGENALPDLNDPALADYPEMGLWRAYARAQMFDWAGAYKAIPADSSALNDYPVRIQTPLVLSLSEVLLREKNAQRAESMLNALETAAGDTLRKPAAVAYLRGEAQRVRNQPVKAIEQWDIAAKSNDQLYRVKAILAQTVLQLQQRAIKPDEAIEKLEKLRFAWRGDGLETQIAQVLGRLYMTNGQWDEAFELMRNAAGVAEGTQEGDAITASMTQSFSQLFTNPPKNLKPLDAVSLYERFPELVPPGEEGKAVLRGVGDFLLRMDLLDRAGDVYAKLLEQDKNPVEIMHDGLQLTAIHLLARDPESALKTLQDEPVMSAKGTATQERQRRLLAAKAFSDLKRHDDAIAILEKLSAADDSLSLIADAAWAAEKWELAARAMSVLLTRSNPDMENLTDDQIGLVFNQAVALKLANNAQSLATLRGTYLNAIKDKNKRAQFEVLTRASQDATLADRQTLLNMTQEVDLFQSFLTQNTAANPAEPVAQNPAPVVTTTPAKQE